MGKQIRNQEYLRITQYFIFNPPIEINFKCFEKVYVVD